MNRIDRTLQQLHERGKKMLSPYITAGDPQPAMTVNLMHGLVKAGADILEIGIPFSDPMAEGPVIQAAMERALVHNIKCEDVLFMVEKFREDDQHTPIVLMGYMNPIEQYGHEKFAQLAKRVGVDGIIIVDLPPEESPDIALFWKAVGIHIIYLCSPTTNDKRMQLIKEQASGYLYYVSLKGVTGSNALDLQSVKAHYQRRKEQISLPIMVGFGIKTAEMAADVAAFADGVIVGAALIEQLQSACLEKADVIQAGATLINAMRSAMDNKGSDHD
jgi:tryptophan synthase alpha chain